MTTDDYGRVILSADDFITLLHKGSEITDELWGENDPEIIKYNDLCRINDKLNNLIPIAGSLDHSPVEEHHSRQGIWFMPLKYTEMDVWSFLAERCHNEEEINRLVEEKEKFEERNLIPLLQLMIYLVDEFRRKKVVWGVGRGSSVASFTLYLIGITKINPILYGLKIGDFLK